MLIRLFFTFAYVLESSFLDVLLDVAYHALTRLVLWRVNRSEDQFDPVLFSVLLHRFGGVESGCIEV